MLEEKIKVLEQQIEKLNKDMQEKNNLVLGIEQTVKNLLAQKKAHANDLHILNGAVQAYKESLKLLKPAEAQDQPLDAPEQPPKEVEGVVI